MPCHASQDLPSPSKKRRLASTPSASSSSASDPFLVADSVPSSRSPSPSAFHPPSTYSRYTSASDIEYERHQARQASSLKLKSAWDDIFLRYSQPKVKRSDTAGCGEEDSGEEVEDDEDDVIDFEKDEIIVNNGWADRFQPVRFGDFADPRRSSSPTPSASGSTSEACDSDDELGLAWSLGKTEGDEPSAAYKMERERREEDMKDLGAFLKGEKERLQAAGKEESPFVFGMEEMQEETKPRMVSRGTRMAEAAPTVLDDSDDEMTFGMSLMRMERRVKHEDYEDDEDDLDPALHHDTELPPLSSLPTPAPDPTPASRHRPQFSIEIELPPPPPPRPAVAPPRPRPQSLAPALDFCIEIPLLAPPPRPPAPSPATQLAPEDTKPLPAPAGPSTRAVMKARTVARNLAVGAPPTPPASSSTLAADTGLDNELSSVEIDRDVGETSIARKEAKDDHPADIRPTRITRSTRQARPAQLPPSPPPSVDAVDHRSSPSRPSLRNEPRPLVGRSDPPGPESRCFILAPPRAPLQAFSFPTLAASSSSSISSSVPSAIKSDSFSSGASTSTVPTSPMASSSASPANPSSSPLRNSIQRRKSNQTAVRATQVKDEEADNRPSIGAAETATQSGSASCSGPLVDRPSNVKVGIKDEEESSEDERVFDPSRLRNPPRQSGRQSGERSRSSRLTIASSADKQAVKDEEDEDGKIADTLRRSHRGRPSQVRIKSPSSPPPTLLLNVKSTPPRRARPRTAAKVVFSPDCYEIDFDEWDFATRKGGQEDASAGAVGHSPPQTRNRGKVKARMSEAVKRAVEVAKVMADDGDESDDPMAL